MLHGVVKTYDERAGTGTMVCNNCTKELRFTFSDGRVPMKDKHLPVLVEGELPMVKPGDRVVLFHDGSSAFTWAYEEPYKTAAGF